eukprot:2417687-Pyramimonas_sp.AAC.1
MDGGTFAKCGPRRSAAHIRLKSLRELHRWNLALALSPRTFVSKAGKGFTEGGRAVLNVWLSP